MALYNFATASVTRDELAEKLADIQKDAMAIIAEGGVSALSAKAEWRASAAALVREAVIDGFKLSDPTPIFTDRRELNQGDTYEFEKLVPTGRVVEYSPQSAPQVFTPRKAKYTIATSSYEHAFGIPLQKVINRQHTIGEFAGMESQSLTRHYVNMTLSAVNVACANGNTDIRGRALRTVSGGADVVKADLDAALRRLATVGNGVTIFGSRWALQPIFDFGATTENLKNELNARGQIATYRGAKMVEVVDEFNEFAATFTKVGGVDIDKLLFLSVGQGASSGAILLEKDLSALDWEILDPRTAQWSMGVRMDHSVFVHSAQRYHVIQLS